MSQVTPSTNAEIRGAVHGPLFYIVVIFSHVVQTIVSTTSISSSRPTAVGELDCMGTVPKQRRLETGLSLLAGLNTSQRHPLDHILPHLSSSCYTSVFCNPHLPYNKSNAHQHKLLLERPISHCFDLSKGLSPILLTPLSRLGVGEDRIPAELWRLELLVCGC